MKSTQGAPTVKAWHLLTSATLLGFFSTTMAYQAVALFADKHQPFLLLFGINAPYWYAWALLVPFVLWLARRFPIARGTWRRSLLVHVPALLVVTFTRTMMTEFVVVQIVHAYWPEGATKMMSYWPRVRYNYVYQFDWEMVTYSAIVLFGHAVAYYREAQERSVSASRLEARLAEAQLQALQRQLHPHFLFNTLNAISALMHRDVEAADQMLMKLSDLLRMALDQPGVQEVALKDELDFLGKYLEIEQARFGDRLTVRFDVDPVTLDAQVPNLLLQPLVENSIRHAIAARVEGGLIEIRARHSRDELILEVRDNGPGLTPPRPQQSGAGVGLANTRSRLEHLYGTRQRLQFEQPAGGGLAVIVTIPFRSDEALDVLDEAPEDIKGVA
jgi:two-component system, LytTR family, sensor kinase